MAYQSNYVVGLQIVLAIHSIICVVTNIHLITQVNEVKECHNVNL